MTLNDIPMPEMLRLTAVLEVIDQDFGRAVAAGVATEIMDEIGLPTVEPDWQIGALCAGGTLGPLRLGAGPGGRIDISIRPMPGGIDAGTAVPLLMAMMEALHEEGAALEARLDRFGAGAFPLPMVPLFGDGHGIITTADEIADAYAEAQWLREIPDMTIADAHGRMMFLRAPGGARQDAFLTAIADCQMVLARAARPGLTTFSTDPMPDWARAAITGHTATLRATGATDGVATWVWQGGPGDHVRAWEVADIAAIGRAGRVADGTPVTTRIVDFPDAATARREARPLLDLGARVLVGGTPLNPDPD